MTTPPIEERVYTIPLMGGRIAYLRFPADLDDTDINFINAFLMIMRAHVIQESELTPELETAITETVRHLPQMWPPLKMIATQEEAA